MVDFRLMRYTKHVLSGVGFEPTHACAYQSLNLAP